MTLPTWLTIPNLIQTVLAGAAIWYTIETRRFRRNSERQIQLLQEHDRLRRQPALIVGVKRWVEEAVATFLKTQTHMASEAEIRERLERCRTRKPILVCGIHNVLEPPPIDVKAILFDPATQKFLLSDQGSDIIPQGQSVTYTFTGREEACAELLKRLQEESRGYQMLAARLEDSKEPFVAVVFKDVAGQEYLFKRPFSIQEGGGVSHKPGFLTALPATRSGSSQDESPSSPILAGQRGARLWMLTALLAVVVGGLVLGPFLIWPGPPTLPTILLGFSAAVVTLWPPRTGPTVRWTWLAVTVALCAAAYYTNEVARTEERAAAAKARAEDKTEADKRYDDAQARSERLFDLQSQRMERLILVSSSSVVKEMAGSIQRGNLKARVQALSDDILYFLADRERGEPKAEFVAMGGAVSR